MLSGQLFTAMIADNTPRLCPRTTSLVDLLLTKSIVSQWILYQPISAWVVAPSSVRQAVSSQVHAVDRESFFRDLSAKDGSVWSAVRGYPVQDEE